MRLSHFLSSLLCASLAIACDSPTEDLDFSDASTSTGGELALADDYSAVDALDMGVPSPHSFSYDPGTLWAPCDPSTDWGCVGKFGVKLTCAKPLSDIAMEICIPQTADVAIDDDCGNVPDPGFAYGVQVLGSAYCYGPCKSDGDCPDGMLCSAHGVCAWHVEP